MEQKDNTPKEPIEQEEPKPEPLTEEEKSQMTKKPPAKKSMLPNMGGINQNLIIAIVVCSFVITYLMSMVGLGNWVTKGDFAVNLGNIINTVDDKMAQVDQKIASVDSAIQSIPDTISKAVNPAISQYNTNITELGNQVNAIQSKVDEINSSTAELESTKTRVTSLETQIQTMLNDMAALQSQISSYENRIYELEQVQYAEDYSDDYLSIDTTEVLYAVFSNTDSTSVNIPIIITNNAPEDLDVDDIEIGLDVFFNIPSGLALTNTIVSGHGYYENRVYADNWYFNYDVNINNLNVTIKSGKTKTIYLYYQILTNAVADTTIAFTYDASVLSYSLD